jgi:hypothetical protein
LATAIVSGRLGEAYDHPTYEDDNDNDGVYQTRQMDSTADQELEVPAAAVIGPENLTGYSQPGVNRSKLSRTARAAAQSMFTKVSSL